MSSFTQFYGLTHFVLDSRLCAATAPKTAPGHVRIDYRLCEDDGVTHRASWRCMDVPEAFVAGRQGDCLTYLVEDLVRDVHGYRATVDDHTVTPYKVTRSARAVIAGITRDVAEYVTNNPHMGETVAAAVRAGQLRTYCPDNGEDVSVLPVRFRLAVNHVE